MLISIVVPVYKVEKYLKRCIESILRQSFTNFELILVDDGSPDNCGNICERYAREDSRIHVIHKENGGLSDARNAGIHWAIENSNSKWITFIDSDDWVHPDYLSFLYKAVIDFDVKISICKYTKVCQFCENLHNEYVASTYQVQDLYVKEKTNSIVAWGKLYLKSDFTNIGFPVGKLHEDEYTTYRLLFMYDKVAFVEDSLYYYFVNPDSITQSRWSVNRMDILDAYKQQLSFFREKGLNDAYMYTARALLLAFADVIVNLRCFYRSKVLLRCKCLKNYYYYRLSGLARFTSSEDKKRISKSVHPQFYNKKKWIKKKARNFIEIIKGRITH